MAKLVHFNSLPEPVRRRLVSCLRDQEEPYPILAERLSLGLPAVIFLAMGAALLAGLGFLCKKHFGSPYEPVQSAGYLLAYAVGLLLAVYAILAGVRRLQLRWALPFPPGRFLFATEFLDATGPVLKLYSWRHATDFRGVHQHINGNYARTFFTWTFEDGARATTSVKDKTYADVIPNRLRTTRLRLADAAQASDMILVRSLDPFFEARMSDDWDRLGAQRPAQMQDGPNARELPAFLSRAALLSVAAAALSLPIWFFRNVASDHIAFATLGRATDTYVVEGYSRGGGRHIAEAKALLPDIAFNAAKQKNTVVAYRDFLKAYPDCGRVDEAHAAIHAAFAASLATFKKQAPKSDPRLVPFVEALLAYLEKHDSPPVLVRFRPPAVDSLAKIDEAVAAKGIKGVHQPVAPIAPHFSDEKSRPREEAITKGLESGFAKVFPAEILDLNPGARLAGDPKSRPAVDTPTLLVSYSVEPSGSLYASDERERAFIGILVSFDVALEIPGEQPSYEMSFTVQPPKVFKVQTNSYFTGMPSMPADSDVYDVMAQRAFDRLGAKLHKAFFHVDETETKEGDEAESSRDLP